MRGRVDQMTGAAANQKAFTNRYSLSTLGGRTAPPPVTTSAPRIIATAPVAAGITARVPSTTWSARRPPSSVRGAAMPGRCHETGSTSRPDDSVASALEQAGLVGEDRRLRAVAQVELGEQPADV